MKKIMFNDNYGLTAAVFRGEKTQTRRDATGLVEAYWNGRKLGDYPTLSLGEYVRQHAAYDVGDVVAVAQSYQDLGLFDCRDLAGYRIKKKNSVEHQELILYDEMGKYNIGDVLVFTLKQKDE